MRIIVKRRKKYKLLNPHQYYGYAYRNTSPSPGGGAKNGGQGFKETQAYLYIFSKVERTDKWRRK